VSKQAVVALAYLAVMAAWVYVVWKPDAEPSGVAGAAFWVGLLGLQVGVGFAAGTWWAILLPVLLVPIAVPAGYGEGVGQEVPIWLYLVLWLPVAVVLVAVGVGLRKLVERRRR
jgi:hypothetical protein